MLRNHIEIPVHHSQERKLIHRLLERDLYGIIVHLLKSEGRFILADTAGCGSLYILHLIPLHRIELRIGIQLCTEYHIVCGHRLSVTELCLLIQVDRHAGVVISHLIALCQPRFYRSVLFRHPETVIELIRYNIRIVPGIEIGAPARPGVGDCYSNCLAACLRSGRRRRGCFCSRLSCCQLRAAGAASGGFRASARCQAEGHDPRQNCCHKPCSSFHNTPPFALSGYQKDFRHTKSFYYNMIVLHPNKVQNIK